MSEAARSPAWMKVGETQQGLVQHMFPPGRIRVWPVF